MKKKQPFHNERPYYFRYRFCIHFPILDNNGKLIPRSKVKRAFDEIKNEFRGYTSTSHIGFPTWFGFWRAPNKKEYMDFIYVIFVDVKQEKVESALDFFEKFRKKYIKIFNQSEVYIIYHEVTKVE